MFRKFVRCVSHSLTEQKACRIKWCQKMIRNYKNGTRRHQNNFDTDDETWLYYYDIRSKRNNQVMII